MRKARCMVLLASALLWSAAVSAEDDASGANAASLQSVTLSVAALLAESRYPSRWNPLHSVHAETYSGPWPQAVENSNLQDALAFSRERKVRSVSLLTFAELGQARLFVGVNNKGVVGVHFDAFSRHRGAGFLEMLRMPYLKKYGGDAE
ncbi:MAG: hypothetical protein WBN32_07735 [Woeseia sp.]